MGIVVLVIFNRAGDLLLSRFFEEDAHNSSSASLQHKLWNHFRIYFKCTNSSTSSDGGGDNDFGVMKRCVTLEDTHFLMDMFGELYFVVGGRGDCDEIVLSDVMDSLRRAVSEQLSDGNLLDVENYGKVSVVIDEIIMNGAIESLDADTVQKMMKLKDS